MTTSRPTDATDANAYRTKRPRAALLVNGHRVDYVLDSATFRVRDYAARVGCRNAAAIVRVDCERQRKGGTEREIGFRLREQGGGTSPAGARVTLRLAGGTTVQQIVTGDSYRSQHANTVAFGLGRSERVESVEIQWNNGRKLTLPEPAVNRYHDIPAPAEDRK